LSIAILFSKNIDITMVISSKSLFHELMWNYMLTMQKVAYTFARDIY